MESTVNAEPEPELEANMQYLFPVLNGFSSELQACNLANVEKPLNYYNMLTGSPEVNLISAIQTYCNILSTRVTIRQSEIAVTTSSSAPSGIH